MSIGKKVKKLRESKMMTQSELSGSEITRNMLSRIENEAALPSLRTIQYLAGRLKVSPSFLLAEGPEEQMYIKYNEIRDIKKAFLTGDYRICRDMCLNSSVSDDDEVGLILAESTLQIAVDEFDRGNLRGACEYFDACIEACSQTIYDTGALVAKAGMYFRYMRKLSVSLCSNLIDENEVFVLSSLGDPFCSYIAEFCSDDYENPIKSERTVDDVYSKHLTARRLIESADYAEAYELLRSIVMSQELIPEPMLYFVFCDYEICCKEYGDFRGAYEYSINKMEILQKMLS